MVSIEEQRRIIVDRKNQINITEGRLRELQEGATLQDRARLQGQLAAIQQERDQLSREGDRLRSLEASEVGGIAGQRVTQIIEGEPVTFDVQSGQAITPRQQLLQATAPEQTLAQQRFNQTLVQQRFNQTLQAEQERLGREARIETFREQIAPERTPAQEQFLERVGTTEDVSRPKVTPLGIFATFEEGVKSRITEPLFFRPIEKLGILRPEFQRALVPSLIGVGQIEIDLPFTKIDDAFRTPIREIKAAQSRALIERVREKPVTAAAIGGAVTFGLGAIGAGTGFVGGLVGGTTGAAIGTGIVSTTAGIGGGLIGLKFAKDIAEQAAGLEITPSGKDLIGISRPDTFSLTGLDIQQVRDVTPTETGEVLGTALADIVLFAAGARVGTLGFERVRGFVRTRGLKEVEFKELSPEFETEAKFPKLKKGETTEQLLKRFEKARLPGEKPGIPRAFTATDIARLAKQAEIPPGKIVKIKGVKTIKSELPGRFGADVPSPRFLRVSGEATKPFGLFEGTGGEPTLIRTTLPSKIKLPKIAPGKVTRTPKRLAELERLLGGKRGTPVKDFPKIKPKLKPGEAVAPLIKGEREIILARGKTEDVVFKRFFTREPKTKVRVPIFERVPPSVSKLSKDLLKDSSKILSTKKAGLITSRPPVSRPIFTPLSLGVAALSRDVSSSVKSRVSAPISSSVSGFSRGLSSSISSLSRGISSGASSISRITPGDISRASSISRASRTASRRTASGVSRGISRRRRRPTRDEVTGLILKRRIPRGRPSKQEGYIAEGLQTRIPNKKQKRGWLRLGKPLRTKSQALDRGSWFTDHSLSSRFRIRKIKDVREFGSPRRAGNFSLTQGKFREFKVRKGKRIPTPNRFIERRRFRLDTSGELRQISLAKLLKSEGLVRTKRKVKRKRKGGKKR